MRLKRIIALVLVFMLIPNMFLYGKTLRPLAVDRKVKLYYKSGESIVGILRSWDLNYINLETSKGEIKIDVNRISKAVYVLGDSESSFKKFKPKPKKYEDKDTFLQDKKAWQTNLSKLKKARILWCVGGTFLIVGGGVIGVNSMDDENSGDSSYEESYNSGVTVGTLIMVAGIFMWITGISKKRDIEDMQYEGRQKGFTLLHNNDTTTLAYSCKF